MDSITTGIATFAADMSFDRVPDDVVAAATGRIFDALSCALGAHAAEPVKLARELADARPSGGTGLAAGRVIGRPAGSTDAEAAAFVNTTSIRYLDYNDWMPNGHPSDMIGGLLAAADHAGVDGRRLITATVVAYEVAAQLSDDARFHRGGWDQGFAVGVGSVAGLGNLLGLDAGQIGQAIGIIASAGLPIAATRSGQLSMWKASATAFAVRNAVFVTDLAVRGMTGPPASFEGPRGIWEVVTGPFGFTPPTSGEFRILQTALKYFPICYHGQSATWAALELRKRLDPGQLKSVEVATYADAWKSIGSDASRWDPRSRETADHSLPYLVAKALSDGEVSTSWFEPAAYLDEKIRAVMSRITVVIGEAESAAYPDHIVTTVRAVDHSGRSHTVTVQDPAGHPNRPMTAEQIRAKFVAQAKVALGETDRVDRAAESWWRLAELDDLSAAMNLLEY